MARDRPSPYGEVTFFPRSAGACPPRASNYACMNDGEGQALALRGKAGVIFIAARRPSDATHASERVSPAMAQEPFFIVARGPVPRDGSRTVFSSQRGGLSPAIAVVTMCVSPSVVCDRLITNRSGSGDPDLQGLTRERWRGTGPRPTVTHAVFFP